MARQRYDIGSKWLLQHYGKDVLRIGGLSNVVGTQPMPGEVVQNRRFPDGLLQAYLRDEPKPCHVLVEIATFPERRARKQAMNNLALAFSALGQLPDLLMLVLRPKGKFRIGDQHEVHSTLNWSRLGVGWRTVELWTLPADPFLAEASVGLLPWVPLMQMAAPPEAVLERCVERIEKEAPNADQGDMLAISELMTGLRFPNSQLLKLFEGKQAMIESPVVQRWKAESLHEAIIAVLKNRFNAVPRDVAKQLRNIRDEKRLIQLNVQAAQCEDLDVFREEIK
jgi:hypothetical protein